MLKPVSYYYWTGWLFRMNVAALSRAFGLSAALCNPRPSTSLFKASGFWQACVSASGVTVLTCGYFMRDSSFKGGLSSWELLVSVWCHSPDISQLFSSLCTCFFASSLLTAIISQRYLIISACVLAVCMSPFRAGCCNCFNGWMMQLLSLLPTKQLRVCVYFF